MSSFSFPLSPLLEPFGYSLVTWTLLYIYIYPRSELVMTTYVVCTPFPNELGWYTEILIPQVVLPS